MESEKPVFVSRKQRLANKQTEADILDKGRQERVAAI